MTFAELFQKWQWRPIRNCSGRYVLASAPPSLSLQALVGTNVDVREFRVQIAPDTVLVARLDDGGLITYKRADGSYLHTLNTSEGFSRKLLQLGIVLG